MRNLVRLCVFSPFVLAAVGCAPTHLTEGIGFAADRDRVRDACTLRVPGRGHLRFDMALRSDLDDAVACPNLSEVVASGVEVLRRGHQLALDGVDGEIDRLSPAGLAYVISTYHLKDVPPGEDERRAFLKERYAAAADTALERDLDALRTSRDVKQARRFLEEIRRHIEPPAGDQGKLGRILLTAPLFLPASIGAEIADAEAMERALVADFAEVSVYRPTDAQDATDPSALEHADPETLAHGFAPIFVQQVNPAAEYPSEDDRIGRVFLAGDPTRITVHVDVDDPVVYWTHGYAKVGDRRFDQLTYVGWYPRRPALEPNDPAAGRIDGVVLRITLDSHKRPAIYEFVRSCGCFHTLWVAEFVEAEAREQYGPTSGDPKYSVQRATDGRERFLPVLVPDDGSSPHRPEAYINAGHHLVMAVEPGGNRPSGGRVVAEPTYRLEPYERLTRLPVGEGVASMFGADGLVHNAGRKEGLLLAPTGMLSAGQPRQLGTMKIRMDAYDYDDPRLLERNLRLPDGF